MIPLLDEVGHFVKHSLRANFQSRTGSRLGPCAAHDIHGNDLRHCVGLKGPKRASIAWSTVIS